MMAWLHIYVSLMCKMTKIDPLWNDMIMNFPSEKLRLLIFRVSVRHFRTLSGGLFKLGAGGSG